MKHPTPEEWMSYLYEELNAAERADLGGHLRDCPECAAKVGDWQAARRNLARWQLPAGRSRVSFPRPVLKWAAAAVILVCAGFAFGRIASSANDMAKLRAALEPEVQRQVRLARAEWTQEMTQLLHHEINKTGETLLAASGQQTQTLLASYGESLETRRAAENQAIYAVLEKLESQRSADFVALKKDVDTVAVNTDAGLRHTEQQLMQLAEYSQPVSYSNPLPNSSQ